MSKSIISFLLHSRFNIKQSFKNYKYYSTIKNSKFFDDEFYNTHYSDAKGDALTHYLTQGYIDGRMPSFEFDAEFYYNNYPDVGFAKANPLLHYFSHGKAEGKITQQAYCLRRYEEICESNLAFLKNYEFENPPLISIIVLNRNGINHLKRLFTDFDEKTNYSNYEIIVVDNASSDESVYYLKSLDLPITIIENDKNVSFSKGNNDAARIANGDYLLLLNNDIEPTYGWLNELVGTMLDNPNAAIVGAKLLFPYYFEHQRHKSYKLQHSGDIFSERMYPCCLYAINKSNSDLDIFDETLTRNSKCISVTAAVCLIDKKIYAELGGLDEDYNYGLEDVDFCLKVYKNGYDTIFAGNALLFHHESSTRHISKDYIKNDKNNYKTFWTKWGDYLSNNLLVDKINSNKFFSQKNLKITIVDDNYPSHLNFLSPLAKKFNESGYSVELISDLNNSYIGNSSDILLSLTTSYDLADIIGREDLVKTFLAVEGDFNDIEDYDIVVGWDKSILDKINTRGILIESDDFACEFLDKLESILINTDGFL